MHENTIGVKPKPHKLSISAFRLTCYTVLKNRTFFFKATHIVELKVHNDKSFFVFCDIQNKRARPRVSYSTKSLFIFTKKHLNKFISSAVTGRNINTVNISLTLQLH